MNKNNGEAVFEDKSYFNCGVINLNILLAFYLTVINNHFKKGCASENLLSIVRYVPQHEYGHGSQLHTEPKQLQPERQHRLLPDQHEHSANWRNPDRQHLGQYDGHKHG
jgi:hypothetical protein